MSSTACSHTTSAGRFEVEQNINQYPAPVPHFW